MACLAARIECDAVRRDPWNGVMLSECACASRPATSESEARVNEKNNSVYCCWDDPRLHRGAGASSEAKRVAHALTGLGHVRGAPGGEEGRRPLFFGRALLCLCGRGCDGTRCSLIFVVASLYFTLLTNSSGLYALTAPVFFKTSRVLPCVPYLIRCYELL